MPILLKDVFSSYRRNYKYATEGDEVDIVAEHGSVLIVEAKNGIRFPLKKSVITGEAEGHPSIISNSMPINRNAKTKKKPAQQQQQNLF